MTKQYVYGITWTINNGIKGMAIEARSLVEVLQVLRIKGISGACIVVLDTKQLSTQGDNTETQLDLFKAA